MLTAPVNGSILYNILKNERIFDMALFLNKILITLIIPLMLNASLPFFSMSLLNSVRSFYDACLARIAANSLILIH